MDFVTYIMELTQFDGGHGQQMRTWILCMLVNNDWFWEEMLKVIRAMNDVVERLLVETPTPVGCCVSLDSTGEVRRQTWDLEDELAKRRLELTWCDMVRQTLATCNVVKNDLIEGRNWSSLIHCSEQYLQIKSHRKNAFQVKIQKCFKKNKLI